MANNSAMVSYYFDTPVFVSKLFIYFCYVKVIRTNIKNLDSVIDDIKIPWKEGRKKQLETHN
jgi:hypothetical protein